VRWALSRVSVLPMNIRYRSVAAAAFIVAVSLIAAACGGSSSSSSPTIAQGPVVGEILTAEIGPFGVGFRQISVTDPAGKRNLDVDVWYPAAKGATGTPARYALFPTAYIDSKVAVTDAPIAPNNELPLVVYAHGSGGTNFIASFLTEQLASQGFVVIAANHTGDTAFDRFTNTTVSQDQNDMNRPADVRLEIDDILARSKSSGDFFFGKIDANRIGLTGHSYGGYTVIADVAGHTTPLGTVKPDARVKAIVAMAPYTLRFTPAELANDKVPTMLLVGTKDVTTPAETNANVAYDNITGPPVVLVTMTDASHQTYTDVCAYLDQIPKLPDAPAVIVEAIKAQAKEGCGTGFMDYARGLEITNKLTTAFLLKYVAGVDGYQSYWSNGWGSKQTDITIKIKK